MTAQCPTKLDSVDQETARVFKAYSRDLANEVGEAISRAYEKGYSQGKDLYFSDHSLIRTIRANMNSKALDDKAFREFVINSLER